MKIIPVIHLQKRKIFDHHNGKNIDLEQILSEIKENKELYLLDWDALEKSRPNLCIYQRFSSIFNLWVDSGVQTMGDTVDVLTAGAEKLVFRRKIWPSLNFKDIKEITDNEIYNKIEFGKHVGNRFEIPTHNDVDGLVIMESRRELEEDYKAINLLKTLAEKQKIFCYENNSDNVRYWEDRDIKGLLVDFKDFKRIKKYGD
ncbi:MAG: hypothetical protein V5A64_00230 [Candidatus Thermoplasmatota archaeon]